MKILICEDQELVRLSLAKYLRTYGQIVECETAREAIRLCENECFDLHLIDLDLESPLAGLDVLASLKNAQGFKYLFTGHDCDELVERAFSLGADGYLTKPLAPRELTNLLDRLKRQLEQEKNFCSPLLDEYGLGDSQEEVINVAINTDLPLMLFGESGTGKSRLAQKIHEQSARSQGPFIALNCSALTDSLLEAELFGTVKGAFTGSIKDQVGKLQLADGGTLFLDEVSTMSEALQVRLLKAIEEQSFYAVGSNRLTRSNFRVISATCEDLKLKVDQGAFREDLYFRLAGVELLLPSLRDNPVHLEKVIKKSLNSGMRRHSLSKDALAKLVSLPWSGNYRELARALERVLFQSRGMIELSDLSFLDTSSTLSSSSTTRIDWLQESAKEIGLKSVLEKLEAEIIGMTLKENEGHVRKTLQSLKISSQALYRAQKMQKQL
jgi:DNA-binding NtrC family response regulator